MDYAEVAVNSSIAQHYTFSYALPSHLSAAPGQAVWVPFGSRVLQGIVMQLTEQPSVEQTRDIIDVIDHHPILFPYQVKLASWISEHYLASPFESAALMLPPGFERKLLTFIEPPPHPPGAVVGSITREQRDVLYLLEKKRRVSLREIEKALGKKKAIIVVDQLLRKGLLSKTRELEKARVSPKLVSCVRLCVDADTAQKEAESLSHRAPKQAELIHFLMSHPGAISLSEIREQAGSHQLTVNTQIVEALKHKGLVCTEQVRVSRDPLIRYSFSTSTPPALSSEQEEALHPIKLALEQSSEKGSTTFLLHGITGSGKTEIYLQALSHTISMGRRGIVLVPEIALTPQTIERFASRFPQRVAILHSRLSLREQFDEWQRIIEGDFDVVIGSRGAIFAPQPDLGLIVIDEEHEWTYKQHDQSPRYHTREVALKLAELTGAVVILGSATPNIESFYHAQKGDYHLLNLSYRVALRGLPSLPEVEVVDMRHEVKSGNRGLLSRPLTRAMEGVLSAGEQIILFLNRRGSATFIQCRDCGFVMQCPHCDSPLTYHSDKDILLCHLCNYHRKNVTVCPQCWSQRIKFLGSGTKKVEEETASVFPGARLLRWDRDVTMKKHAHEDILHKFTNREADILIGTQMIAKGLDLPAVTLVGVISADTALRLPDFRAAERTFQLLTQVAGRAGREALPGRVIIQTFSPYHYAIRAAAKYDYESFYEEDAGWRRQYGYPPFTHFLRLIYLHTNQFRCQQEAERVSRLLRNEIVSRGIPNLSVIGPSPAFLSRIRGRFRWQIILRGSAPDSLLREVPLPQGWAIDVDPVSLL